MSDEAPERTWHLFEAIGVELESMIVDRETLAVRPIADRLLEAVAPDGPEAEVEFGSVAWSNELVLHVIELKTNGPAASLAGLAGAFQENVARIESLLEPLGARILPTGMHPFMDPHTEARLWPHEYGPVYRTYDRIFDCRGHGWSNLQSTHVNLPFDGDDEFGRLHAAIRLVLPILPALAASSPIADGRVSRWLDTRMEVYRHNSARVPSVAGVVVPEPVFTEAAYEALLESIWADLAPLDPEGILRHPWVNSRGCIARFDRGSIEIRVIDAQESALADVAVTWAVTGVVRALVEGRLAAPDAQRAWSEHALAATLRDVVEAADGAVLRDAEYLRCLGFPGPGPCTAGELWRHLVEATAIAGPDERELRPAVERILAGGCLARRILRALPGDPRPGDEIPRGDLRAVYGALADCARDGRVFEP